MTILFKGQIFNPGTDFGRAKVITLPFLYMERATALQSQCEKSPCLCLAMCCCQSQGLCRSQGFWHCRFSLTGSTYNSLAAFSGREIFDKVGVFSLSFFFLPFIDGGSKALNKQLRKRPIGY